MTRVTARATGPVALVTGGSGGIGSAVCRRLARSGHRVAIGHHAGADAAQALGDEIESSGGTARPVRIDVTDPTSIERAFSEIQADLGPVEVLVFAAGVTRDRLLVQLDEPDWHHTLDHDLTGVYRVTRRALRPMIRARQGRIVMISSIVAATGSAGQANYAAAKSGLVGFSRSVAREVATRGITANVVEPGPITTPMTDVLAEERRTALRGLVPMQRFGTPNEVAATVDFLCSADAGFITGAVVPVDGGLGLGR